MSYNKDELEPPKWMDKTFFVKVLQSEKSKKIEIIDYKITPATALGDHYASVMFRAVVKYSTEDNIEKNISIIVKTLPMDDGYKKEFLEQSQIFETEIAMYSKIIPKFHEILQKAGDNTKLGAKMLYSSLHPYKMIVFEDITKHGFGTIGKRAPKLEEIKLAFTNLAKWHAASRIIDAENPGSLKEFSDGVFNMPGKQANDLFTSGIGMLITLVETIPELGKYLPKLRKAEKTMFAKCQQTYNIKSNENLKVLIHGDFHAKNMMFKFDKNDVGTDVMLVDFQLSIWTSMAVDVLYGIYMLVDYPTRKHHRDELVYYFFQKFIQELKVLGYKKKLPTFSELKIEMIQFSYLELFFVSTFSPFMNAMLHDAECDPAALVESSDARLVLYKNPYYIQEIKEILPTFNNLGLLDGYDSD